MDALLSLLSLIILLHYADILAQTNTYTTSTALALDAATHGHLSPTLEHVCGPDWCPSSDLPSLLVSHPIHR